MTNGFPRHERVFFVCFLGVPQLGEMMVLVDDDALLKTVPFSDGWVGGWFRFKYGLMFHQFHPETWGNDDSQL